MSDQNPDDTGVWRPPAAEPSWFTPSKRPPRPDARVWPPPKPEPDNRGTSTMPIPVVDDDAVGPVRQWRPPGPSGPAGQARSAHPGHPQGTGGHGQAPGAHPQDPGVRFGGPPPATAAPDGKADAVAAPAEGGRRRPPKAAKIGLRIFGALGLAAVLLGVKGYDQIQRYEAGTVPAQVRHVPKGQEARLENATWRVLGVAYATEQPKDTPDRVTLQIDLQATAVTPEGGFYTTALPGFFMTDGTGRTWLAEASNTPKELNVGVPGKFTLVSVVPKALADRVELTLWKTERQGLEESGPALWFDR